MSLRSLILSCVAVPLLFGTSASAEEQASKTKDERMFAALPYGITSFGAARTADAIYVYGGHTGGTHSYSNEEQSNQLLRLDLKQPKKDWQVVSERQRLQGLALVAYENKLICVGGFEAVNAEGQEHDVHSQSAVVAYDTLAKKWSNLASMPTGRSSHDAVLIGNTLYVVGGWNMDSPKETEWHTTALSLDLSKENATWQELPEPPFQRRAIALAAHQGKLYVVGGMNHQGGPTKDVAIYDPSAKTWTNGPAIHGDGGMSGFGASAWSTDGRLVVSSISGDVQVLSQDGSEWNILEKTEDARFFHRILPLESMQLISIGGASMESGKFLTPEVIRIGS